MTYKNRRRGFSVRQIELAAENEISRMKLNFLLLHDTNLEDLFGASLVAWSP
jgi:hypothetical protein